MGFSTKETIGLVAVVLLGVALITGAIQVPDVSNLSFGDDKKQPQPVSGDMVSVDDWEVGSQIRLPTAPNSADVYLFKSKPDNYGNHVDWDASLAKDGLSQGVDYYAKTGQTTETIDLGYIPSGEYWMVVEDNNFHDVFMKVAVKDRVPQGFAENSKQLTLADTGAFDQTATYGSDNIISYDKDGNVLDNTADLPDASANASRTVKFVREIEVKTGMSYLGKYDVTSFNDGDGIEDVAVTVKAGGHTCTTELKDGNSGELADSTSFGEDLHECISAIDNVETEPVTENSKIKMIFDITYDANTAVASAGDAQVGPGEALFTLGLDDIYGSDVSTATYALTG